MSDYPIKNCDYCGVLGVMPTFMDGETICYDCLRKKPKSSSEAFKALLNYEKYVDEIIDRLSPIERNEKRPSKGLCLNVLEAARLARVKNEHTTD